MICFMKSEKGLLYLLMAVTAVFSVLFSIFFIKPALIHHFQQIAWHTNGEFLAYYLNYTGGPSEYVALFMTQFFYSNILGGLIISCFALITSLFTYKTLEIHFQKMKFQYLLIPLIQIFILALMCDYQFHFSIVVNLLLVSAFLFICAVLNKYVCYKFKFHTLIAGVLLYYLSGGAYFIIFMLSALILLVKKLDKYRLLNATAFLTSTLLVPLVAYEFLFLSSLRTTYLHATPIVAPMLRYQLSPLFYASLAAIPVVILMSTVLSIIPNKGNSNQTSKGEKKNVTKLENKVNTTINLNLKTQRLAIFFEILVLLLVSILILYTFHKPLEKLKAEIDYYAYHKNWDKVIALSTKVKKYDRMINFQYNRALSHKGLLLEKLFSYEQILGSQGLFIDVPFTSEVALPNSDLYFDLGNIEESQRFAFEAQTAMPYSPRVLKRLALNCIILNQKMAAATFINVLANNPMENAWVEKHRILVADANLANTDSLIAKKRMDMHKTASIKNAPSIKLISLLDKNPANKAAFEYLLALDLLDHNLNDFLLDLEMLPRFHIKKLPTVVEEAIVLFRTIKPENEELRRYKISSSTMGRFRQFSALTNQNKGDKKKAKQATAAFKNTYWYYVLFLSPKVTNIKIETKSTSANY